ncbi:MAG: hypothetical protein EAZ76_10850 [Nostocales cyanobacterium]|nr:MAG: hypothetical protein EAZ87_11835 [Nostocales cyanobacterium]TAF13798.1 MAG: hypothetical protein EAZ76_10850 [Nostocales cyanobacterium]
MNTLFNVDQYDQPVVKYVSDPYWDELEKSAVDFVDDNNSEFLDDTQEYSVLPFDSVTKEDYPEKSKPKNDSVTFEVNGVYWHQGKGLKVKIIKIYHSVKKADVYFERDFDVCRILLSELSLLVTESGVTESQVTESGVTESGVTESQVTESDVTESQVTESQVTESGVTESLESEENDSVTAINIYKPSGKARGDSRYFRFSYKSGNRTKHVHIPGGNTSSPVVRNRVEKLKVAIAQKLPPGEIEKMIKQFKSA